MRPVLFGLVTGLSIAGTMLYRQDRKDREEARVAALEEEYLSLVNQLAFIDAIQGYYEPSAKGHK